MKKMKRIKFDRLSTVILIILSIMLIATITFADRFIDNGDGTVTDNITKTVWLKNANCFDLKNWSNAISAAAALGNGQCGLTDGSSPGDWHLATLSEFQGSMPGMYALKHDAIAGDAPFTNVKSFWYWTSTEANEDAWVANVHRNETEKDSKNGLKYVWPVKSTTQGDNCGCATVDLKTYEISIPCLDINGTKYKFKFKYVPGAPSGNLTWKIDLSTVEQLP